MKFSFLIILSLLFFCCNNATDSNNKTELFTEIDTSNVTDNKDILGEWALCSESDGNQIFQKNQCWSVIFYANGMGNINKITQAPETFNWTLKNKSIKFYYSVTNKSNTFTDTTYFALINKREGKLELNIESYGANNGAYYLSK